MPHQDDKDGRTDCQVLKEVFEFLLPREQLEGLQRHGNATFVPFVLAATAIACWGWAIERTLSERLQSASVAVRRIFRASTMRSRQGICAALARYGGALMATILGQVQERLRSLRGHWLTAGRPTYAMDGSKFAAPRTRANQARFAPGSVARSKRSRGRKKGEKNARQRKRYRKASDASKAQTPQVLLTLFWHLGSGLPACWRLAPSTGSERDLAREMLDQLPAGARVVGDAEYVGYPLWSALIESGRWFVIRVGANIQLLKKLGYMRQRRDLAYYWPDASLRRGQPPLVLRLIKVTKVGRHPIWLVTNERTLSEDQLREIYKARWGIEVFFRTVKQNCQKAKLLCRTPDHVEIELNWTLLGIWAALFIAKLKISSSGGDPDRVSPVRVVDAFARALCAIVYAGCRHSRLSDALAAALRADESQRTTKKTSRNYPKKKKHRPCGQPTIRPATPAQIQAAKALIQC